MSDTILNTELEDISNLRKKVDKGLASLSFYENRIKDLEVKLSANSERWNKFTDCRCILQASALGVHSNINKYYSEIICLALSIVYDKPYKFKLVFETKRQETECRVVFERDGLELSPPLGKAGFGPVDVAAFAWRAANIKLFQQRQFLFSDEPFRNVSPDRMPYAIKMVEILNKKLGIQMVIITNKPELIKYGKWDKRFRIENGAVVSVGVLGENENRSIS